jgi:aspartate racemase
MNNLADRIAGLSPAKRALIELRLKKKGLVVSGKQRIPQREKLSSASLSFAQQRLWFLNQLGTGSAYNIPMAIRLKGLPNIKALEESLNEIIRRHEALRTTFRSAGGRPVQVIAEKMSFEMPLIDLSGQPKTEREVEAERLTRDEAMRRFDLAKGPLFCALLIRLSEEEHILVLTMHHIVSDGWSMGVFTAELAALYKAFCNGEASPLPELPIQYADFANWQREWLQSEILEKQLTYWRKQLEGVPVLQLFTDRPRPSVQTYEGASQNIALSPTLTGALNDLSQRQGVTLFMTLLAAFQTLLCRYTGQEDIVVGSPIANRNRAEIEGLIGFFVNSLVMRTDLSGNPTFRELLGRVREMALGAYEHQDLPFEKLVEELHPQRDMSRTPLFQIMFIVQNMPAEELQLPGLTLSSFAIERITVRFDIEIHLWEKPEGLSGRVVYNTDLFDDATIARLMGHYETLLESIVADPNKRISDVQILTNAEHRQLLIDWNNTSSKYPRDRCVHQLFEQQVEQSPDAVAVVYGDEQLTYRQLNTRANQLARYLNKLGVGPEVLVGICLERSLEMIIAVLGILKAGGAYVPLDPEYPQELLTFMLADTQTPVLLTQQKLLSGLPETATRLLCLDSYWEAIGNESHENPISDAVAESLAYVMYTSGSTGRPKGVCVTHRNVVRLVKATNYASLSAEEVFLQFAPISFDASTLELWGPLWWRIIWTVWVRFDSFWPVVTFYLCPM